MVRILKAMRWTLSYWKALPPDEQEFWLANDAREQHEIDDLRRYKMMWSEDGQYISDPAAHVELRLRQI
jgi:hypothetical protein